ncbi:MAG: F0F1 ATP synthase subunit delta, partial [Firmicutes bacterium]|nr:F0F1 ATP synthase subunit delta [Bacillota bacterium]
HVVVSRRRERSIRGILRAGLHACLELAGVEVVQVTTAVPLSPEEQEMARKQLATALGKPVHPEFQVNPGLRGGIIIRRGEQLLDASLLGILRRIGESLAAQPGLSLTPNPFPKQTCARLSHKIWHQAREREW